MATLKKNPDYSKSATPEALRRDFLLLIEELNYMFYNLTPEENFSDENRAQYGSIFTRLEAIEKRLDELEVSNGT